MTKDVIKYLKKNSPKIYWGPEEQLSSDQIKTIIENPDSIFDVENDLYELNLDYIWQLEYQLVKDAIENFDLTDDPDDFRDKFIDHISVDLNFKDLLNNTPAIDGIICVYSNYDCAVSFSTMEPQDYLYEVYQRVKLGLRKKDYAWEASHIYGGSLLYFVFKTPLEKFIDLKNNFKNSVTIPKGTQFGFFSTFVGSGSSFECRTTRALTLSKVQPDQTEYDCVAITADCLNKYSMQDVYGGTSFIDEQEVTVK